MKLLVEVKNKDINGIKNSINGVVLYLKDYAVLGNDYYTVEEIKTFILENPSVEVFVIMNKNIFEDELRDLLTILTEINTLNIKGLFFYDLSIIELVNKHKLNIPLVWNQTHMVTNYNLCNYFYNQSVSLGLMTSEITLEDMIKINNNTKMKFIVEVIYKPQVAFSRRKLNTNFSKTKNIDYKEEILINEKITNQNYKVVEDNNGTGFILDDIINGTSVIKELGINNFEYILIRDIKIDNYNELIKDTYNYINNNYKEEYINKYRFLGDNTNFFYNKTIYKVKKNG